jgi:hypothetical protein
VFVLTLLVLWSPFAALHVTSHEPSLVATVKAMSHKSDTMVLEMLVARVAKNASRIGARVEALIAAPHAAQLALVKKRHREQRNVEMLVGKASGRGGGSSSSNRSVAARTRGALDATLGAASGINATRIASTVERLLAAASASVVAEHAEQRKRTAEFHASLFAGEAAAAAAQAAAAAESAGGGMKAQRRTRARRKRGAAGARAS